MNHIKYPLTDYKSVLLEGDINLHADTQVILNKIKDLLEKYPSLYLVLDTDCDGRPELDLRHYVLKSEEEKAKDRQRIVELHNKRLEDDRAKYEELKKKFEKPSDVPCN